MAGHRSRQPDESNSGPPFPQERSGAVSDAASGFPSDDLEAETILAEMERAVEEAVTRALTRLRDLDRSRGESLAPRVARAGAPAPTSAEG